MPCFFATLDQRNAKKKTDPESHGFRKCHVSLPPWAREMPKKTDPERHEFWQRHNSSLPWARESPNPTVKYMNFAQTCTH